VRKLAPRQVVIPWAMCGILHHSWIYGHNNGGVILKASRNFDGVCLCVMFAFTNMEAQAIESVYK
jgi:hypothetical protein